VSPPATFRRSAAVLMAVFGLILTASPLPVSAAEVSVLLSAPRYDSPGALVPVIVTAVDVPSGYTTTLTVSASRGVLTCTGQIWRNPIVNSISRKCYLTLAGSGTTTSLVGKAVLTNPDTPSISRSSAPRAVQADGYATATMSLSAARLIERCHNTTDHVQLTFDDGASGTQLRSILTILKRNNARGTFFFLGTWAAANPDLYRLIRAEGHMIGNHSYDHPPMSRISNRKVLDQIRRGTAASTTPQLLRPPYAAGALTQRLVGLAAQRQYSVCRWTTDTYDWNGTTATAMAERVRYGDYLSAPIGRGGVILMHGTGRYTASGLQAIIDAVRAKGLQVQPLT